MAIKPYQRSVGLPDAPSPSGRVGAQIADSGSAIANIGQQLLRAADPIIKERRTREAIKDAGEVELETDEAGNLILPEAQTGGSYYRAAFDRAIQTHYVNQIKLDYENWLNEQLRDMRAGELEYDPETFKDRAEGRMQGIVEGAAPQVRIQLAEELGREMLERTRSFGDEWSRGKRQGRIRGMMNQLDEYHRRLSMAGERNLSAAEIEQLGKDYLGLIVDMETMIGIEPEESTAMMMRANPLIEDAMGYLEDQKVFALNVLPFISSASEIELNMLETAARLPGTVGHSREQDFEGLTGPSEGSFTLPVDAEVNPRDAQKFGAPREKGKRYHKGIDIPAPVGTEVRPAFTLPGTASVKWAAKGGNIVEIDHGGGVVTRYMHLDKVHVEDGQRVDTDTIIGTAGNSGRSFGPHLHLEVHLDGEAVDPLPLLGQTRTVSGGDSSTLTRSVAETLADMDPAVRQQALALITDRRSAIRERQQAAAQEAAAERRHREQVEKLERVVEATREEQALGIGGNWTADQRKVFEARFAGEIDISRMHDPNMRAAAVEWIQRENYVPRHIINYMDNAVRSDSWKDAVQAFRSINEAVLPGNVDVGDMLVTEFDPRTLALLQAGDSLLASGMNDAQVATRLESIRSGKGFTPAEARTQFNTMKGEDGEGYQQQRNALMRRTFSLPQNAALPKPLVDLIDQHFAAQLEVHDRNPMTALQRAVDVTKGLYVNSPIFDGGVGPSILTKTFTPKAIATYLVNLRGADGKLLVPQAGKTYRFRLIQDDNATGTIGRYNVKVIDPETNTQVDFWRNIELSGMYDWVKQQPREKQPDFIAQARKKREATSNFLRQMGERADRGPKY